MLNIRHLLRMARWARNPPSTRMVILVFGILAAGLMIAGIERFVGWPDFLTVEKPPRRINMQPLPTE